MTARRWSNRAERVRGAFWTRYWEPMRQGKASDIERISRGVPHNGAGYWGRQIAWAWVCVRGRWLAACQQRFAAGQRGSSLLAPHPLSCGVSCRRVFTCTAARCITLMQNCEAAKTVQGNCRERHCRRRASTQMMVQARWASLQKPSESIWDRETCNFTPSVRRQPL